MSEPRITCTLEGSKYGTAAFVDALIDPAAAFPSVDALMEHPGLSPQQKLTLLLAWLKDALALEQSGAAELTDFQPVSHLDGLIAALQRVDPGVARDWAMAREYVRRGV